MTFWAVDSPLQPTTMAMLMLLDAPMDEKRLRQAFERAVHAVPRLAQRVVDAPLGLTLPHWEADPTFDLDYHVRGHALSGAADLRELFHEISPAYETPFDRTRPLWEARLFDGIRGDARSALFFKLHHAVADGVGGNAIFAAMTDWQREPSQAPAPRGSHHSKGSWPEPLPLTRRLAEALRDRIDLGVAHATAVASTLVDTVQHPGNLARAVEIIRSLTNTMRFDSHSPLRQFGRARRLAGLHLPFAEVREVKQRLGGSMIDVILTIMARAIGKWHAAHGMRGVRELLTLVPVNLRKRDEWAENPNVGNVATGILLPLPIHFRSPLSCYREIHKRMEEKKADPASAVSPVIAELASLLPRSVLSWLAEATFGNVDYIVTNVPGILVPRYLAGAEILAAYPFAPVAMRSPVSIALYGYRDRLFIGINADETSMRDTAAFERMIRTSFRELRAVALEKGTPRRGVSR